MSSSSGDNSVGGTSGGNEAEKAMVLPANDDGVLVDYLDSFPKGYIFAPTDKQLVKHYLSKKVAGHPLPHNKIVDVVLYRSGPEELAALYKSYGTKKNQQWYFFTPRDRKYRNGTRPNRAAGNGYWKATGADKEIKRSNGNVIGYQKTLVYYKGRPPGGEKTNWIMYEYREKRDAPSADRGANGMKLDDCVLCKIRQKSKPKPKPEPKAPTTRRPKPEPQTTRCPKARKTPTEWVDPTTSEFAQNLRNSDQSGLNNLSEAVIVDRANNQASGYHMQNFAAPTYMVQDQNPMMNNILPCQYSTGRYAFKEQFYFQQPVTTDDTYMQNLYESNHEYYSREPIQQQRAAGTNTDFLSELGISDLREVDIFGDLEVLNKDYNL
ncbi:hypothetical protein GIB67_017518 [Kingdonia uniflora]|uniref:NAC domain-containing protein n=1 Tax=Kingdonia uniflora TaxID=39325 RepID=A0A7J7M4J2_9MAGN|nr:hypothetical protein GIB67_017518 [Kingdonia uniflora]